MKLFVILICFESDQGVFQLDYRTPIQYIVIHILQYIMYTDYQMAKDLSRVKVQ